MIFNPFFFVFFIIPKSSNIITIGSTQARAGPNAQQLCKNGKRTMFPHEEYCDYYYECINGEAIVQSCPNGLAFAGHQKGLNSNCDYPHRAGCPDGARVMGRKLI